MSQSAHDDINRLVETLRNEGEFVRTVLDTQGVIEYHHCKATNDGVLRKMRVLQDETVRALEKAGRLYPVQFIGHKRHTKAVRVII